MELVNAGLFTRVGLGKNRLEAAGRKKRESEPLIKEILTLLCAGSQTYWKSDPRGTQARIDEGVMLSAPWGLERAEK